MESLFVDFSLYCIMFYLFTFYANSVYSYVYTCTLLKHEQQFLGGLLLTYNYKWHQFQFRDECFGHTYEQWEQYKYRVNCRSYLLNTITSWYNDLSWKSTSSTCSDMACPGHIFSLTSLNHLPFNEFMFSTANL